ncbi:APTX family protein [Megaselia abdita]
MWKNGLIQSLKDPSLQVISSDIAVVIKDKYPKAKYHFLVLPKEDISSIFKLTRDHLPVLDELRLLATNVIEVSGEKEKNFKIGFHAIPSMTRLHLHVISKDFISPCLKTKKHWNSFTTKLFIDYDKLYEELEKTGSVKRIESTEAKDLENSPLKCNHCSFEAKTIPSLKDHLLSHLK